MDERILQLLESDDPQNRKRAVAALAKSGDPDALQLLARAFKREDDQEVKQLIVKAGKYLKQQIEQDDEPAASETDERVMRAGYDTYTESEAADNEPYQDVHEAYGDEEERVEYKVSAMQAQRANTALDMALNFSVQGKNKDAEKQLVKALKANPNLRYEHRFAALAIEILDLPQGEAVEAIVDAAEGKRKRKAKPDAATGAKRKMGDGADDDEIGWDTALLDLAIYFVVMTGLLIVSSLVQFQFISGYFAEFGAELNQYYDDPSVSPLPLDVTALGALVAGSFVLYALSIGLVSSAMQVILLLIQYFFIHIVAKFLLAGDGTFRGLIHRLTTFITVTTVIATLGAMIYVYWVFNTLFTAAINENEAALNSIASVNMAVTCGGAFVFLLWLVRIAYLVGKNYESSTLTGCFTIVIAYIFMFISFAACTFALGTLFAQSVNNIVNFSSPALLMLPGL